jgi:metal-sulfur cluster biosynthetic enzyme
MTEVQSRDGSNEVADFELARALEVASGVPDPEVPCVTVADLGILRSVTRDESGRIVVRLTPTYSGCPAVIAIEMAVETALLLSAGIRLENRACHLAGLDHRLDHRGRPRETQRLWHRPAGGILRRQARCSSPTT